MASNILYFIVILSSFAGFLISLYIYHKKSANEEMICPLNFDCETVIYSKYSKFFGVPLEFMGMGYYLLIFFSYVYFLTFPNDVSPILAVIIYPLSIGAFLFSGYLVFIQAFNIKEFCTWCLFSAGLSTIIFVSALALWSPTREIVFDFVGKYYDWVLVINIIAAAVGLGGATISDILFFKFLKDFKISLEESDILHVFSQVIWFALGIVVVSGIGLYLPHTPEIADSPRLLAQIIMVGVVIVNGALLNLLVSPKLVSISFGEKHDHEEGELKYLRKMAFALGSSSIISWYAAFVLAIVKKPELLLWQYLTIYLAILLLGFLISQVVEKHYSHSHF